MENILGFPKNRCIPEIICSLILILQGGIAFFAIFSTEFRISRKIARNGKNLVTLPDLKRDSGFPEKSLIYKKNLTCFHEIIHDRMFSERSQDFSFELMSIKYVGFIYHELEKIKNLGFWINLY